MYDGESGLNIYNNTFDVGGSIAGYDAAVFSIGTGSLFQSIRNNLFTAFNNVSSTFGHAFVSSPDGTTTVPRVVTADYNGWFNPTATSSVRYLSGIVANTPGVHDVLADPKLAGQREVPYRIAEGCVWLGGCTVGQVLAHYRDLYRPATGSPLINAGDPADGNGTAIGAIGPDGTHPLDKFGRIIR
jgi:hypothetical protein